MDIIYSVGAKLGVGGVGAHAGEAVNFLQEEGLLKLVISAGFPAKSAIPSEKRRSLPVEAPWRLPAHRFFYPHWLKDFLFDISARRWARGADILHSWNGHCLFSLRRAKRNGMKTIVERNSLYPDRQEGVLRAEFRKLGLSYQPTSSLSLRRNKAELAEADFIATPSEAVRRSLREAGLAEEKLLSPNPLGVDFSRYGGLSSLPDGGRLNFLFIGGDAVRKGLYYLLRAWQETRKDPALAKRLGRLFLLGLPRRVFFHPPFSQFFGLAGVENVGWADSREYFAKAQVFVLPSVEDGWGLVVGEAMASGLAVLVSEGVGAGEMVTGDSGFIVPVGKWKPLLEKLRFFADRPEKAVSMGREGRKIARRYSWKRYGSRLLENYKRVVG